MCWSLERLSARGRKIVPMNSDEYARLEAGDGGVTVIRAMRSKR
jgi:hypothetical protein